MPRRHCSRLAAKVVDVLSGVNGAREPVGLVAVAVPRIADRVAIHDRARRGGVYRYRLAERFDRDAVFVHAPAYPRDQALTRIPVEVEQPLLFFSLFHHDRLQLIMFVMEIKWLG